MDHIRTQRHPQAAVPAPLPSPPPPSAEELRQLRVARHQASQRAQQNAAWARELLAASAGPSAGPSAASAAVDGGRFAGLSAAELRTRLAESEDALVAARTAVDRAAGRSWCVRTRPPCGPNELRLTLWTLRTLRTQGGRGDRSHEERCGRRGRVCGRTCGRAGRGPDADGAATRGRPQVRDGSSAVVWTNKISCPRQL